MIDVLFWVLSIATFAIVFPFVVFLTGKLWSYGVLVGREQFRLRHKRKK